MTTGFHAYWIYVTVKNIHFGSRKYDITKNRLPRKEQFLKSWNSGRKDRDGIHFLKFMERVPENKEKYIRCFASYYMSKPTFHITDVFNDNFQTFKANELELNDILATAKSDYLTAALECTERDIKFQNMFYGTPFIMPIIYRLYDQRRISVNSLIAFDEVFKISTGIRETGDNIVNDERAKKYRLIFDKYRPIVYDYFKDIAWKDKLQKYHHEIMESR